MYGSKCNTINPDNSKSIYLSNLGSGKERRGRRQGICSGLYNFKLQWKAPKKNN